MALKNTKMIWFQSAPKFCEVISCMSQKTLHASFHLMLNAVNTLCCYFCHTVLKMRSWINFSRRGNNLVTVWLLRSILSVLAAQRLQAHVDESLFLINLQDSLILPERVKRFLATKGQYIHIDFLWTKWWNATLEGSCCKLIKSSSFSLIWCLIVYI